jgi:hypothetical protein
VDETARHLRGKDGIDFAQDLVKQLAGTLADAVVATEICGGLPGGFVERRSGGGLVLGADLVLDGVKPGDQLEPKFCKIKT